MNLTKRLKRSRTYLMETQPQTTRTFNSRRSTIKGTSFVRRLLRRTGKREEAVQLLEGALKGQDVSDSIEVLYSLGETYEEMLQFDKAVATYEEALTSIVNPDGTAGDREGSKQAAEVVLQRIGF